MGTRVYSWRLYTSGGLRSGSASHKGSRELIEKLDLLIDTCRGPMGLRWFIFGFAALATCWRWTVIRRLDDLSSHNGGGASESELEIKSLAS